MNKFIAYCGLNCETCEARIATVNNDDNLRKKVAAEWSELNQTEITPEMINCTGCRMEGAKTPFCDYICEIKKCGCLTEWIHMLEVGQQITIRGPYGNGFPVDTDFAGKDLLFIAGGIGLAPLHSVINYCRAHRANYGSIDIVYGSRSKADLVDFEEILNLKNTFRNLFTDIANSERFFHMFNKAFPKLRKP